MDELSFHEKLFQYFNGYFPVPNFLVDILQPILTGPEWKVFTVIWRETIGRQRWKAYLSLSLIVKLTKSTRPTVNRAIRLFEKLRLFKIERDIMNIFIVDTQTLKILGNISKEKIEINYKEELLYLIYEYYQVEEDAEWIHITPKMWEELLQKIGSKKSLSKNSEALTINNKEVENGGENNSFSE